MNIKLNSLDIKQRGPVLQLVLAYDANCLKDNSMLLDAVAESLIKHPKGLELTIERLVAGSCATLEFSYIWRIMGAQGTDGGLLSTVPLVANYLLASGYVPLRHFSRKTLMSGYPAGKGPFIQTSRFSKTESPSS